MAKGVPIPPNLSTQHGRLRWARERAGYPTVASAAQAHGWNTVTYRSHESGFRSAEGLKTRQLQSYAHAFGVSEAWLATGQESSAALPDDSQTPDVAGRRSRGFARDWMMRAGLKQADLVSQLGYSKAKANAIWHGDQRLNEDILEELSKLLGTEPYELLMDPELALILRRVEMIAADLIAARGRRPVR